MGRIRSQIINGYIEVVYHEKNEWITIRDIQSKKEVEFRKTVIPIIVKTLKSNKKGILN